MSTPGVIGQLVERFDRNLAAYKSPQFNETELRVEFVNPFWSALGWDMENKAGYAMAYRDVIHEDAIKVGTATKAPDYCFRTGGARKFFLETKRPSCDLKTDPLPAYQLRRYGWSAKLPLSVLTDFEELIVYDCRQRPRNTDKASQARIRCIHFKDYPAKWEEISSIFSREAVLKGSFDRYVESTVGKRGTAEVDAEFLKEIESWRDVLARNIALRNPKLTAHELNFAVQMTIDRIIFLRMCEDRGIELYGRLQALCGGARIYPRLLEIYRKADERYNSGLFHFEQEKNQSSQPDELTTRLTIDDKVLKDILSNLYYPDSPYEFRILPPEILGNVYEQFLGKVIRLTEGHQAKVEEKPEVRKAGGVYYTPSYIVDYIVNNTVGKLLENKTPGQAAKLCILDPACGSGSFLLGAYRYLLDWHLKAYLAEKEKTGKIPTIPPEAGQRRRKSDMPVMYQGQGGDWLLTTAEKKRILLNNIYGVDIDPQAVEVTKLSLLLKVLENENQDSLQSQLTLWHERALPDLSGNIKCGNSLIGPDFYQNRQLTMLDEENKYRINAFDWQTEFSEVLKAGGFDAVIGNPPWGCLLSEPEKDYLFQHFVNRRGEAESHLFFVEQSHRLLRETGRLGFITPNTWLAVLNSKEIREYLLKHAAFSEICELSKYIFADAPDIVPILVFLGKRVISSQKCVVRRANVIKVHAGNFPVVFTTDEVDQSVWLASKGININLRATGSTIRILTKSSQLGVQLGDLCDVTYGIKTGNNEKFVSKTRSETHKVKALKTGELVRYRITWKGFYLWWCNKLAGYRVSSLEIPKIVVQYIRKISLPRRLIAALDEQGVYYPLNNYSYVTVRAMDYSLLYILGIFNSALINFYFANTFIDYNIKPTYLQQLPIRPIDFSNVADKSRHDRMVALVESMLGLHKRLLTAKTPDEKNRLEREIAATDREIDRLVYELYGLTEDEIKIVEGQ